MRRTVALGAAAVGVAVAVWFTTGSAPPDPAGVRGRLLAADGTPLIRWSVLLHAGVNPDDVESLQQSVQTSTDGAFTFSGVPAGDVELQVPADQTSLDTFSLGSYYTVSFRHDGRERIVRLPGGVPVGGAVAGRRPGVVRVRVGLCPLAPARAAEPAFVGSVPVGADGRYRIDGVPPGRYAAVAWQEWPGEPLPKGAPLSLACAPAAKGDVPRESCYVTVRTTLAVGSAAVDGSMRFPDAATRGRVPVGHANVLLMDAGDGRPAYAPRFLPDVACVAFVQADEKGRFEVPGLTPGRYLVRVTENTAGSALVVERTVDVAEGAELVLAP